MGKQFGTKHVVLITIVLVVTILGYGYWTASRIDKEAEADRKLFIKKIENHYKLIVKLNNKVLLSPGSDSSDLKRELNLFKKYSMLDYKDVEEIYDRFVEKRSTKKITEVWNKQETSAQSVKKFDNCYELGYKYGMCATKSLHGLKCKPENDIVIPDRCRDRIDTSKGIQNGVKAVYTSLNLRTDSTSLNMLTAPLEVLRNRLHGKTKNEVKKLVGRPNRIEYFSGNECWIYGKTYTTKDRGVVFKSGKVLTVSFY
jgi:hypothetical protein